MSRFGSTGKVLVKVDREVDPYQHIDRVREEVFEHVQRLEDLERDVKLLKLAEQKRVTDSGVWKIVKGKLEEETIDWVKWAIRGTVGVVATLIITAAFRLIWKYT
jgi:hypothetical protein